MAEKHDLELAPCPLCGGHSAPGTVRYSEKTVREQHWGQDTFHYVNCIVCGTKNLGLVGFLTPEAAAQHWNTRTPDSDLVRRALELADEFMLNVLETEALPPMRAGQPSVWRLIDDEQRQVTELSQASKSVREAVEWLVSRGQGRLVPTTAGLTLVVEERAPFDLAEWRATGIELPATDPARTIREAISFHCSIGKALFAGGGMAVVDRMNAVTAKLRDLDRLLVDQTIAELRIAALLDAVGRLTDERDEASAETFRLRAALADHALTNDGSAR